MLQDATLVPVLGRIVRRLAPVVVFGVVKIIVAANRRCVCACVYVLVCECVIVCVCACACVRARL